MAGTLGSRALFLTLLQDENRKLYISNAQKLIDKQESIDNLNAQVVALSREVQILKLGLRSPAGSVRRLEAEQRSSGDIPSSPLASKSALSSVKASEVQQKAASPQQLSRTISGPQAATLGTGPSSAALPTATMVSVVAEKQKEAAAAAAAQPIASLNGSAQAARQRKSSQ